MTFDAHSYSISIRRIVVEGEPLFCARVAELPHVAAYEPTYEEAYKLTIEAITSLHAVSIRRGRAFPPPIQNDETATHSGRITLRMPRWLHAQLDKQAANEGISLNQYLVSVLSAIGSIGEFVNRAASAFSFAQISATPLHIGATTNAAKASTVTGSPYVYYEGGSTQSGATALESIGYLQPPSSPSVFIGGHSSAITNRTKAN